MNGAGNEEKRKKRWFRKIYQYLIRRMIMRKSISIVLFAFMICATSLFATEEKKVMGLNSVQDVVMSADSERAIKRLEALVSGALLKVGRFTVAKKESNGSLRNVDYLLDLSLIEYSEETMTVKKMMQRNSKYSVEVKLLQTSNNHILIQEAIKGSYSSAKVSLNSPVPNVYDATMEQAATKISAKIVDALFTLEVLKVSETGIITLKDYGFEIGEVLNVYRSQAVTNQDGEDSASEDVMVCAIVILEISGSTARAMIPASVKAYKKYAKVVVESGMFCKRSGEPAIDKKTIAGLIKKMEKAK